MWEKDFTNSLMAFLEKIVTKFDKKRKFHESKINSDKVWQKSIAMCDRYYKVRQNLVLQALQSVTGSYYKIWQLLPSE